MIRKDYILRMIEEIGKMIAAILGLLKNENVQQAKKLYDEGLVRIFDLGEDDILEKEAGQLRVVFENQFGESFEGLEVVANFLVKGGDIHIKSGDEAKAKRCYVKALELYNIVEIESATFSLNRQADMGKVSQLIDQICG